MRVVWTSMTALAMAGALANCGGGGGGAAGGGGGGGGGGGLPPVIGRSGPDNATDRSGAADFAAEQSRNYGLAAVGADAAHLAGRTGAGVTVGVVDTGIDLQHQDFDGAISAASIDIVTNTAANVDDYGGHGTSVAGVIAARKDGYDALGVAPDATLLAVRADAAGSCDNKCFFYNSDLARATDYAAANGAQIINYSLGGASLSPVFQASLANAMAQGVILVAAAGNDAGNDPIYPARWLSSAAANGMALAVGAVDAANNLAAFSNKAGNSKDYFLVAPGVAITTSKNGGGVRTVNGTSFAAPHVSGAAAVVLGAAPYLTGAQVVDILLQSATDLGAPGTDAVYGRGLLNLDAALQPLGEETVPTGTTLAQGGAPLSSTALALGGAFGDASAPALDGAVFVDAYGRPFRTDLSRTVTNSRPSHDLAGWLDQRGETVTSRVGATSLTLSARPDDPLPPPDRLPGTPGESPRFAMATEMGDNRVAMARGFGLGALTGLAAATPEAQAPGLTGDPLASPWLGLAGDGTSVAAGHRLGDGVTVTLGLSEDGGTALPGLDDRPERRALLAEGSKRFRDGSVLGVQAGNLSEADGPLASSAGGALGFDGDADTVFTGLFGATPISRRLTLFGHYGMGLTDGDTLSGGLWRDASTIRSESFALGASLRDVGMEGDRVAVTVSRPLRVTAGEAVLAVPVGRTMDGGVVYRAERVDLTPSGAETDLEMSWTVPLADNQRLVVGGTMAVQPGHDADAPPAFGAGAKYRLRW